METGCNEDGDDNDNDDNDKGQQGGPEDHHHNSIPNCRHEQLLVGWKWGAMRMGTTTTMMMTRDDKEDLRTTTMTASPTAAMSNCLWGGNRVQ